MIQLEAMRMMATDILEAHTNLLLAHLLMDKIQSQVLLRLATLPTSHPLHAKLARARRVQVKAHRTLLHNLCATYRNINPAMLKKVEVTDKSLKWKPWIVTCISKSRRLYTGPSIPQE